MLRWMFSTPTTTVGAVNGCPSTVTCSPVGLVWNVIVEVRGRTSRVTAVMRPCESATWRLTRKKTFGEVSPIVGTKKEPLVLPLVGGRKGWMWQVCGVGQWWKSTHQVKRLAGSLPSSGSVAVPAKLIVSPPE